MIADSEEVHDTLSSAIREKYEGVIPECNRAHVSILRPVIKDVDHIAYSPFCGRELHEFPGQLSWPSHINIMTREPGEHLSAVYRKLHSEETTRRLSTIPEKNNRRKTRSQSYNQCETEVTNVMKSRKFISILVLQVIVYYT